MKIITSNRFDRRYTKIIKGNAILKSRINSTLKKLSDNPFEPSLRTHKLKGRLEDNWSCSVAEDLRILFQIIEHNNELCIYLDSIGKHDEVY